MAQLLNHPELCNKRVLLIDRELKNKNDKTWCYWSKAPLPFPKSHVKDWSKCEIGKEGSFVIRSTGEYKYREINSFKFYQEVDEKIEQFPNVDRVIAEVLSIAPKLEKCRVDTDLLHYEADIVINSIPGLMQKLPCNYFLTQNFKGIRIKTIEPIFDPKVASLMDFYQTEDPCASTFFYVLPYSRHEALIEYTRFSAELDSSESYDPYIEKYLEEKYGLGNFEILESEIGVIPMTDFHYQARPHPRVFQIGTVAGDTKPTTGYTFHFIQKRSKEIIRNLASSKNVEKQSTPSRFRFYDALLLSIMLRKPQKVKEVMFTLFSKVSLPLILKFLDERTSVWEEVLIFSRLPKRIFLAAIFIKKPKLYATNEEDTLDRTLRRSL